MANEFQCGMTNGKLLAFVSAEIKNNKRKKTLYNKKGGLGDTTVERAWSNGYAICKDPDSSPTYDQWSLSHVTRFLHAAIELQC